MLVSRKVLPKLSIPKSIFYFTNQRTKKDNNTWNQSWSIWSQSCSCVLRVNLALCSRFLETLLFFICKGGVSLQHLPASRCHLDPPWASMMMSLWTRPLPLYAATCALKGDPLPDRLFMTSPNSSESDVLVYDIYIYIYIICFICIKLYIACIYLYIYIYTTVRPYHLRLMTFFLNPHLISWW